jgi:threonylcarbamoyladenosine tRNA methylthiotransferase MtaB
MKTVSLNTLGCKLNFSETSTIGNEFIQNGFTIVDQNEKADVYLFNTCTVTENAEKECRQLVRRALRINPEAYIIVTGCYAQLRPEEIVSIDGVDAVLGSNEKFKLFSVLKDFNKKNLSCVHVSPLEDLTEFGVAHSTDADSRTRAFLKIQDGCDYNCSFCTIPLARGNSRSMNLDSAIKEFKSLVESGYKEIILTGVNVGDYGKNLSTDFYSLLSELVKIEGDFRIRISSIEPNLLSDNILNLVAENEKICHHFHIPLQSGSPDILKRMQRRYTASDYKNLILKIKRIIPDCGIGVDVIVGFPGETEDEFIKTHNFLRDLPISYLHVFTYSERPDTKAISLSDKVDVTERRRRNKILRILSDKKRNEFRNQFQHTEQVVLFEEAESGGTMKGFSSNYIKIAAPFNKKFINKFCWVRLTKQSGENHISEIVDIKNSVDLIMS